MCSAAGGDLYGLRSLGFLAWLLWPARYLNPRQAQMLLVMVAGGIFFLDFFFKKLTQCLLAS